LKKCDRDMKCTENFGRENSWKNAFWRWKNGNILLLKNLLIEWHTDRQIEKIQTD